MRLVFMGTPDFSVPTLVELVGRGYEIAAVYTRAPKPAGRGMELTPSPIERTARGFGLQVLTPKTLRTSDAEAAFRAHGADAAVVVAYGLILPKPILDGVPLGCVNLHASALPRWRGAAPIQRVLLAGDARTGISVMQMNAGLDTGPVLMQEPCAIAGDDTAGTLHDRLAGLGARLCVEALDALEAGALVASPQRDEDATYAQKIRKEETRIDWRRSAASLQRQVRAFNPTPGAGATLRGAELKLWSCSVARGEGAPGEVLRASGAGIVVACGEGAIEVTELQRAGGRRLGAADFLRGFPVSRGERFALDSL
jgi:methionyl-tRNA formyltransferase